MNCRCQAASWGLLLVLAGCGSSADSGLPEATSQDSAAVGMQKPAMEKKSGMMKAKSSPFRDDAETNAELPGNIDDLTFVNQHGEQVKLTDYRGKKNVVLVITRGFSGRLCPFCRTQSSRLVANYEEFTVRDAEVLLVYPGDSEHLDEFISAAKVSEKKEVDKIPFPILLDTDLKAVNFLQIAAELAYPSTYILDKEGNVRFAYVGEAPNDRPSVDALLKQLDQIAE